MGHCIRGFVGTPETLRAISEPLCAKPLLEYIHSLLLNTDFVYLKTDYFGGEGIQRAAFFTIGKMTDAFHNQVEDEKTYPDRLLALPINTALRMLGVVRVPGSDDFDTLHLGRYRRISENNK